jgi:hypothetical protein
VPRSRRCFSFVVPPGARRKAADRENPSHFTAMGTIDDAREQGTRIA